MFVCENASESLGKLLVSSRHQLAAWSSGMILASGARGPGFNSRSSPVDILPLGVRDSLAEDALSSACQPLWVVSGNDCVALVMVDCCCCASLFASCWHVLCMY